MKKHFSWVILRNAVLLILVLSAVSALASLIGFDGSVFRIGFPSPIVALYLDKMISPACHISLSGLALDLLLAYAACWLIDRRKHRG